MRIKFLGINGMSQKRHERTNIYLRLYRYSLRGRNEKICEVLSLDIGVLLSAIPPGRQHRERKQLERNGSWSI